MECSASARCNFLLGRPSFFIFLPKWMHRDVSLRMVHCVRQGLLLRRRRGQISDRWRRNCSIMIIALTIIIARSKLPSFWRSTFFRSLCWFELTRVVISPHCCCSFLSGSYSGRSRLTLCAPLWPMDNTRSTTSWLSTRRRRRRRRRRRSTTLWLSKQARSGFLQLAQSILVIRTLCANC